MELVERVLNRVRPLLQAEGGDLQLVRIDEDDVVIKLTGACSTCPQAHLTLHYGIEAALRRHAPSLRVVRVS